ncbi:MAG TPA: tryptophan--tRNA ligase [Bacillota bacterium]|jgi:tryptophanyl-tRNA synthetase
MTKRRQRILTGDRATGPLHLGHYAGSLANRVKLQHEYDTLVLIADVQALTTHYDRPEGLAASVRAIALDYLAVGIDPEAATIVVQSMVPAIAELTVIFSMLVTVNALRHNPTIKTEAAERGYADLTYGFLGYPVSQAADIAFCRAELVPVGDDQVPHIELARRIIRRFNEIYGGTDDDRAGLPGRALVEPRGLLSGEPRLVGLDGRSKMSKSLRNSVDLTDPPEVVRTKVAQAVTDPSRVHARDPGHPQGCTVFAYRRAFQPAAEVGQARADCEAGRMGCVDCKRAIQETIIELLAPMAERRAFYQARPGRVEEILMAGTSRARRIGQETMELVRNAMQMDYFRPRGPGDTPI